MDKSPAPLCFFLAFKNTSTLQIVCISKPRARFLQALNMHERETRQICWNRGLFREGATFCSEINEFCRRVLCDAKVV